MFLNGRAEVKKEPLQTAASGSPYKVNNHLDHKYRPQPVDEIITSAKRMIGDQKTYIVLLKNSERFVADLRYGLYRRELVRPLMVTLYSLEFFLEWENGWDLGEPSVKPAWYLLY